MIAITGATGNTGSYVASNLVHTNEPNSIVALVRETSDTKHLETLGIRVHRCDLSEPSSYLPVIEPGATFVGIANLRTSDVMVPHLERAEISRSFFVTTTTVFSGFESYSEKYRQIERRLTAIKVPNAVLRPSMIYGNDRDRNMCRLIRMLQRTPVFPVFGPGTALIQPVFIEDLARSIANAVDRNVTGAYNLAGPAPLPFKDVIETIAVALNKNVRLLHVNHSFAATAVKWLEHVPKFPLRYDQIMRNLEDKAFDISRSVTDLDHAPREFSEGIRQEIQQLRDRD